MEKDGGCRPKRDWERLRPSATWSSHRHKRLRDRPKAESFYDLTPYNSMGGNPVSMVDPDGDAIFAAIAIGAFVNFAVQGFSGKINSTGDAFLAMGIGGVAGALGAASAGLSTSLGVSGILPGAAYGAGAGAVTGGVYGGLNSFLNDDISFG